MVDSAADGLSEYEQLRLENIRRNQAFLIETLGLSLLTDPSIDNSTKRRKPLSNATDRQLTPKRIRASPSIDAADDTCVVVRRSSRVATLPTVNYTEVCCLNIVCLTNSLFINAPN